MDQPLEPQRKWWPPNCAPHGELRRRPTCGSSLPRCSPQLGEALRALILTDADEHRRRGLAVRADRYFRLYPGVSDCDWAWEIVAAELQSRSQHGDDASWDAFAAQFPTLWQRVRRELAEDRPVGGQRPDTGLEDGELIDDFEIVSLLGQGGHARVYLARQRSLDRLLALKVSPQEGDEGRALARLSHPHIVAVFSESIHEQRKLLAMQYVPGKTLAAWVRERQRIDVRNWRSGQLLSWLERDLSPLARSASTPGLHDAGQLAGHLSFVPAMCEIITGLAQALDHAHRHGVLHRDVKPANVLLDVTGRALLTDFSVAARQDHDGRPASRLGGTTSYMAPEHLQAMESWLPGNAEDVDTQSDLYSLGVVFFELLCGRRPFANVDSTANGVNQAIAARMTAAPELPQLTGATPALRAIVRRLLAPQRRDRYGSTAELLEDLRRWREDRPPRFAPDPSLAERIRRWSRRHRIGVAVAAAATLLSSSLLVGGVVSDVARLRRADQLIDAADRGLQQRQFAAAALRLGEAEGVLSQPSTLFPDLLTDGRRQRAESRLAVTRENVARHEFRQFDLDLAAARSASFAGLMSGGVDGGEVEQRAARWLQRIQESGWDNLAPLSTLDDDGRRRLQEAVTELILLRCLAAELEGDPPEQAAAGGMLEHHVPAVHRQLPLIQSMLAGASVSRAELASQGSEFELYLCGLVAAARGDYASGARYFDQSLSLQPSGSPPRFWAAFSLGYCLQKLDRATEAVACYGQCIGLRPDFAWPRYNLALVFISSEQWDPARRALEEAISLDPQLSQAHADLGAVLFQLQRYKQAISCCDKALELGLATSPLYANRAASKAALNDLTGARQDLQAALRLDPNNQTARASLQKIIDHDQQ